MHVMSWIKRASCIALLFAAPMLGACSRIVSVEPLAADLPASAQNWEGGYVGELDTAKRGKLPMLLKMKRRGDGVYDFTLYTRGAAQDLFAGNAALDLIGRGEARLADVGENLAVAQTRCEIAFPADIDLPVEPRTFADMMDVARRFGAASENVPHSKYLGPYVYTFVRGTPARVEAVLAVGGASVVTEAAAGTSIDVDKWETGVGDGMLLGAGMIFESDDVHIANHGAPGEAGTFFAHLAQKLFAASAPNNAVVWTRVEPERMRGLRFSDRFPGRGRLLGWCNLMGAAPG